jgi:hypothetical protein
VLEPERAWVRARVWLPVGVLEPGRARVWLPVGVLEPGRVWPQAAQRAYSRDALRFSLPGQALVLARRLVRQLAGCALAVERSERAPKEQVAGPGRGEQESPRR